MNKLIQLACTVSTVAAGAAIVLKGQNDQTPCTIENVGTLIHSSCDITMPSTTTLATKSELANELGAVSSQISAIRDDICAIRLTQGIAGHNLAVASIANHDGSGDSVTMKSTSDGKCKYRCKDEHHADHNTDNDECKSCLTPVAGDTFTSTVCSIHSNTVLSTCTEPILGQYKTSSCTPGSASSEGSNAGIESCVAPADSTYTTLGSCDWECNSGLVKSGNQCTVPTDFPTAAPTEAPTDAPTDFPTAVPTAAPTNAMYHLMMGNPNNADAGAGFAKPNGICAIDTSTTGDYSNQHGSDLGVTCCDSETSTTGSRPGCKKNFDFDQAEAHCAVTSQVLCSKEQLRAGAGRFTGCSFDHYHVWTRDACTEDVTAAPTVV
jgi:hypothetical protein